jgi:hypothetical protein
VGYTVRNLENLGVSSYAVYYMIFQWNLPPYSSNLGYTLKMEAVGSSEAEGTSSNNTCFYNSENSCSQFLIM